MLSNKYGFDLKGYIDVLFYVQFFPILRGNNIDKGFFLKKTNAVNLKILYHEIFTINE